jgi:hypothetical protein
VNDNNLIMEVPKEDEIRTIDNAYKNGYVCEEKEVGYNTVVLKFRKAINFNIITFKSQ